MSVATFVLAQAAAAQLAVGAYAPPAAAACEAIEVLVTASAPGHVAPLITPPPFGAFQLLRHTARPNVRPTAAGDMVITVEHRYVLATDRVGTYTLPPFRADWGGLVARTRPLRIEVRGSAGPGTPSVVAEARIDTSRAVNFQAMATPDTVYVGQQAQYEVAVFLHENVRDRLRRNPTFFPPDMPAMLAYDLPTGRGEPPRRQAGGRCFDALVYQRAIFPLQAGRSVIPPAQLVYSLPLGRWSGEETHELRTDSVVIVALDPPAEGRPANFSGAVGTLDVAARVDTARGRVGDPVTLTVRVSGEANVKLLPRPAVSLPWATLVPDGERVEVDSGSPRVRGAKEFDWLLTPRESGARVVPPLEYAHFDPYARRYAVARTDSLRLEIEPAPLARIDTVTSVRRLAIRETYRGPLGTPLHSHPAVWMIALAAPLPALFGVVRGRRRPGASVARPGDELAALGRAPAADARTIRRAYVNALAARIGVAPGAFARAGALERSLRRGGVTRARAAEAERLLRELDAAAFGGRGAGDAALRDAAHRAERLYRDVDDEALPRRELGPYAAYGIAVAIAGAAATVAMAAPADDLAEFRDAVASYHAGAFRGAKAGFEQLALREPRAPDAWANYGTAAWAANDTAGAVVGWQRALRLEPHAADVRQRLDELRLEPLGSPGYVPPVGVTPLALTALLLWVAACAVAAARPRRGGAPAGLAIGAAAGAVALAVVAVLADERLAADDAVVLRRGGTLSLSPALGARREGRAETGEVGVAGAREGGWTHVRFDDARAGWIPAADLVSIERAPPRSD